MSVRVAVAERQYLASRPLRLELFLIPDRCLKARLEWLLMEIFGKARYELHHDPALTNRDFDWFSQTYDPPANDPRYLIYLRKDAHGIRTRVRGEHGQHSDLAIRRIRKRRAKKAQQKRKHKIKGKSSWPNRRIQSRPFASSKRTISGRSRKRT